MIILLLNVLLNRMSYILFINVSSGVDSRLENYLHARLVNVFTCFRFIWARSICINAVL